MVARLTMGIQLWKSYWACITIKRVPIPNMVQEKRGTFHFLLTKIIQIGPLANFQQKKRKIDIEHYNIYLLVCKVYPRDTSNLELTKRKQCGNAQIFLYV